MGDTPSDNLVPLVTCERDIAFEKSRGSVNCGIHKEGTEGTDDSSKNSFVFFGCDTTSGMKIYENDVSSVREVAMAEAKGGVQSCHVCSSKIVVSVDC